MASNTESTLLGSERSQYTLESENGRQVQVTDSKIIVEKGESISGRALRLNKISMMRKRKPRTSGSMWGPLPMIGLVGMIVLSIFVLANASSNGWMAPETLLLLGGFLVFSFAFFVFPLYKLRTTDNSPPEGIVFMNIRASDCGVGFKMKEEDIPALIRALDENMEQAVSIKDET